MMLKIAPHLRRALDDELVTAKENCIHIAKKEGTSRKTTKSISTTLFPVHSGGISANQKPVWCHIRALASNYFWRNIIIIEEELLTKIWNVSSKREKNKHKPKCERQMEKKQKKKKVFLLYGDKYMIYIIWTTQIKW